MKSVIVAKISAVIFIVSFFACMLALIFSDYFSFWFYLHVITPLLTTLEVIMLGSGISTIVAFINIAYNEIKKDEMER